MKTYCLVFKPLSTITRFPDAQTIFGAICNIILNTQGQDQLNRYLSSFETDPWFIHSSMMPEGLFPMVNETLFSVEYINNSLLTKSSENQIAYLTEMKKYKKIQWMSENVYMKYILKNRMNELREDLLLGKEVCIENNILKLENEKINFNIMTNLNTHVRKNGIIKVDENDRDNELYYDSSIYCSKETRCCIYVKSNISKEKIRNIFSYAHYFGFGDRHSVGKNSFMLVEITEKEVDSNGHNVMLLSKASVDENFAFEHSFYTINSKLYKTSKYYLNNKLVGRMNLLNEGSLMTVNESKDWYGRLIANTYDNKKVYYYALGFVF